MAHRGLLGATEGRARTRVTRPRALVVLTVAALATATLAGPVAAPAGGAVHSQSGKAKRSGTLDIEAPGVTVLKKGAKKFEKAKDGAKVKTGETIQTDATGLAEIEFSDGSLTRLDHDTVFTIEKLANKKGDRRVQSSVTAGQTWNRVQKLSESDTFQQEGNGATAAVLGTAFVTKCDLPAGTVFKALKTKKALKKLRKATSCKFTLIDGRLGLSKLGTTVPVGRGQSVDVAGTGGPGDAITLPPDILFTNEWIVKNLAADAAAGKSEAVGEPTAEDILYSRIVGPWAVTLTVLANDGFRDLGGSRERTYTFAGSCTGGACSVTLTRQTADGTSVIPLGFANGVYSGEDPDLGTQDCLLDDGTVSVPGGLRSSGTVSLSPTAAVADNGLWRATGLNGTVTETATQIAGGPGQCRAGSATFALSATR